VWGTPAAALGRRIHEPAQVGATTWREIVGVVQDVHEDSLDQAAPSAAYWPVLMAGGGVNGVPAIAFVVRSERAATRTSSVRFGRPWVVQLEPTRVPRADDARSLRRLPRTHVVHAGDARHPRVRWRSVSA